MPYNGGPYGIKVGQNQGTSTENMAYGPQEYGIRTPPPHLCHMNRFYWGWGWSLICWLRNPYFCSVWKKYLAPPPSPPTFPRRPSPSRASSSETPPPPSIKKKTGAPATSSDASSLTRAREQKKKNFPSFPGILGVQHREKILAFWVVFLGFFQNCKERKIRVVD